MSTSDAFDRQLAVLLEDVAMPRVPDYFPAMLERTRRTRQRPAWAFLERWVPMNALALRLAPVPRLAWLVLVLALAAALAASLLIIGAQRHLPLPYGPAGNGLIAYADQGNIVVSAVDGTNRRVVSSGLANAVGPAWAPDGTHLAFWFQADSSEYFLAIVDENGGHAAQVAAGAGGRFGTSAITWAPDGRHLAFTGARPSDNNLYVVNVDGSGLTTIGAPGIHHADPSWSPDGTWIAYQGFALNAPEGLGGLGVGLYLIHPDGSGERRLPMSAQETTYSFTASSWSPDGSKIAYYYDAFDTQDGHDVAVYDLNADRETILSAVQPGDGGVSVAEADEFWPRFSPDGSLIVFESTIDNSADSPCPTRIHLVSPDGTGLRTLAAPPVTCYVGFSPDGRYLVVDLAEGAIERGDGILDVSSAVYRPALLPLDGGSPQILPERIANDYDTRLLESGWQRLAQ